MLHAATMSTITTPPTIITTKTTGCHGGAVIRTATSWQELILGLNLIVRWGLSVQSLQVLPVHTWV